MKKGVHLVVSGMVQGVGFRYYVHRCARQHRLRGWVKNMADGSVEILAEGYEDELKEFIADIKKGARFSRVDEVKVDWRGFSNKFRGFAIVS